MAQLRIAPEVLAQALFGRAGAQVHIHGARFDGGTGTLVLDISGPGVPDVPEVDCRFADATFHPRAVTVDLVVNGKTVRTGLAWIGYDEALLLAGVPSDRLMTVQYHSMVGKGCLLPGGEKVAAVPGMQLEVVQTGNA